MLLSLCLSCLSLSLFQHFANHFSLSLLHHEHDWTNCLLLLPVCFFQALLQMVQLLMIVHLYMNITPLIALDLYCILKYIVFLNLTVHFQYFSSKVRVFSFFHIKACVKLNFPLKNTVRCGLLFISLFLLVNSVPLYASLLSCCQSV